MDFARRIDGIVEGAKKGKKCMPSICTCIMEIGKRNHVCAATTTIG